MKQVPPLLIIRLRNESCLYGRKTGGLRVCWPPCTLASQPRLKPARGILKDICPSDSGVSSHNFVQLIRCLVAVVAHASLSLALTMQRLGSPLWDAYHQSCRRLPPAYLRHETENSDVMSHNPSKSILFKTERSDEIITSFNCSLFFFWHTTYLSGRHCKRIL